MTLICNFTSSIYKQTMPVIMLRWIKTYTELQVSMINIMSKITIMHFHNHIVKKYHGVRVYN